MLLAIPNASRTVDDVVFTVTATAAPPGTQPVVTVPGTPPVPTVPGTQPAVLQSVPPRVTLSGRPAPARPGGAVRIPVRVNGAGKLHVQCTTLRHSRAVVVESGNAVLEVVVPLAASTGGHVCYLVPLSASGAAGQEVPVKVVVDQGRAKRKRR